MTPDALREFLTVLGEVSQRAPEIRLGQLLAHLGFLGEAHLGRGLADLDDDELLAVLYRHRGELAARTSGVTEAPNPPSAAVSISGSVASLESATPSAPK